MGRVKGGGEREEKIFFLSSPSPLSFFRPRTYRKGYYFYSPQSSTVIKSKMAATTILRTRTRFHPPKIRLRCRLERYFSHLLNNRLRVGWIFLTFHFFEQILIPLEGSKNQADSTVVRSR